MQSIANWVISHIGLSVLGGSAIGAAMLSFAGPRIIKAASVAMAKLLSREISDIENLKTGNPAIDGRVSLGVLCLMDAANIKMPDAPGEDKKKYVMGFFSNATPAIQTFISAAIDQLWITWKASIAAGVTAPQEAIIADAVAKLTAIAPASVLPPANPPA
jgi:hypothetical protein